MSAWEILQAPLRKVGQLPRPELRRVPIPARRMPMVPFAGLVIALLAIGMVGLLLLNTHLQDRAVEIRAAQRESTDLAHRVSDLESEVNRANSPANLAGRASELGMVPNPNGVFIDLTSGKVIGVPKAVTGTEYPSLKVLPNKAAPTADPGKQVATTVVPWFNLGAPAPATPTTPAAPATTAPTKSAASTKPATKPAATKPTTKTTAKPTTGGNR